ncbi:MAG TPA: rhodanese-like domain-containing protein [Longimicrobiales bacterium]
MIVKRFYEEKLAQASYLLGCAAAGEAVVVDPNRDIEQYVAAAEREGVRITAVAETHIHADFVSGVRELAARTGATKYLSGEGGADWAYAYAGEGRTVLLKDGDAFRVGNIRIEALHTPGHTPEHLTFLVTDGAVADQPIAALTGDFVFVGDVGRPDLLEKAAGVAGTMEPGARRLFRSLQAFKRRPDWLQIWPGHGAGSACGKGLSAIPHSTVGYERLYNWAFRIEDEDEFVRAVLTGQPEPPKYFARMKRVNREGPALVNGIRRPERLPAERLEAVIAAGALVIDTREAADFAAGHVPGTINIPLGRSFSTWAGWLLPADREFYLIVDAAAGAHGMEEAARDLAMIGLDAIGGYFTYDAVDAWAAAGRALETVPQLTVEELAARSGEFAVLDVRGRAEWDAARLPETVAGGRLVNVPLGYLPDRLDEVPTDRPVVVHCQAGARSAIAASVLRANGFDNVMNLVGGFAAWEAAGLPVVREGGEGRAGA